jgi:hypothetical protein
MLAIGGGFVVAQPENNSTERKIKAIFPICIDSPVNFIGMGRGGLSISDKIKRMAY